MVFFFFFLEKISRFSQKEQIGWLMDVQRIRRCKYIIRNYLRIGTEDARKITRIPRNPRVRNSVFTRTLKNTKTIFSVKTRTQPYIVVTREIIFKPRNRLSRNPRAQLSCEIQQLFYEYLCYGYYYNIVFDTFMFFRTNGNKYYSTRNSDGVLLLKKN